jgi:hypothetical protein
MTCVGVDERVLCHDRTREVDGGSRHPYGDDSHAPVGRLAMAADDRVRR